MPMDVRSPESRIAFLWMPGTSMLVRVITDTLIMRREPSQFRFRLIHGLTPMTFGVRPVSDQIGNRFMWTVFSYQRLNDT